MGRIAQIFSSESESCNVFSSSANLQPAGCGKFSVFFSDRCEVGYSDIVAEGFEAEFSSLGRWFAACQMVSVASLQGAVG